MGENEEEEEDDCGRDCCDYLSGRMGCVVGTVTAAQTTSLCIKYRREKTKTKMRMAIGDR